MSSLLKYPQVSKKFILRCQIRAVSYASVRIEVSSQKTMHDLYTPSKSPPATNEYAGNPVSQAAHTYSFLSALDVYIYLLPRCYSTELVRSGALGEVEL